MEEILNNYGTEIAAAMGVVIGWLLKKMWSYLESYVAKTSNSFDDELLNKIKESMKEVLQETSDK